MNALRTRKVAQFMTGRITDVAKLGTDLVRAGNFVANAAPKLTPQLLKGASWIGSVPKKLRLAAILALTVGGTAYAWAKSHEDIEKKLVEDGFWDPVKRDVTSKMIERFSAMKDEEKRLFIGALYTHFVERIESTAPMSDAHFENGVYGFVVNTEAEQASLWTVLNAHDPEF